MIVCSCNILSCRDIRGSVETLLSDDLHAVLTPGKVYRCLGKRLKCGGCMENTIGIIHKHAAKVRRECGCGESCSDCLLNHSNVEIAVTVTEAA